MSSSVLPVAVIGVGGFGRHTLAAISQCPSVKLVGVCDQDSQAAAKAGKEFTVDSFTDNRALLAQAKPQAVFAAVPPPATAEILRLCAEREIHVWKEMPLARNLHEAAGFIRRMDKAGLKLAVGTQRRFSITYRLAHELCGRLGQVFLARSHYLFNWGTRLAWRGDKASAGGGAAMELAYHAIDLLVWMLGLPDAVWGLTACDPKADHAGGRKLQPPHDTDDTALAMMRYNSGSIASVVATRSSGPVSEELSLHGRGGSIIAGAESCLLRDPDGNVLEQATEDVSPSAVFVRQIEAFVQAVQSSAKRYACSARENLLNLAVVEAIYLSDRTAQPESPLARLKAVGLELEDCRKHMLP